MSGLEGGGEENILYYDICTIQFTSSWKKYIFHQADKNDLKRKQNLEMFKIKSRGLIIRNIILPNFKLISQSKLTQKEREKPANHTLLIKE